MIGSEINVVALIEVGFEIVDWGIVEGGTVLCVGVMQGKYFVSYFVIYYMGEMWRKDEYCFIDD